MKAFQINVTTATGDRWSYSQIAHSSFEVHTSALDRFGLCAVFVRPL